MNHADPGLEGRPESVCYPILESDAATLTETPLTQNLGHPTHGVYMHTITKKTYPRECSDINVFYWFPLAYLCLYLIPFSVLVASGELNLVDVNTSAHLAFAIIYILSYLTAGGLLWVLNLASKPSTTLPRIAIERKLARKMRSINSLAALFGWLSVFIIIIYYAAGGYKKILLLGSNIDSWDYRIIGYDDVNRVLTGVFEVARRILMPYALLIRLLFNKYQYSNEKFSILIFTVAAIFGAVVNLDRGPIFLYLTLFFFYYNFTSNASAVYKILFFILFLSIIGIIGSVVTYLQYNSLDIDLTVISQTFFVILIDRLLLDPVRMAELYCFADNGLWSNPLYLKYSRIGALFGRQYVGTENVFSVYVTPVGLVGDIWRNFGMLGAYYIGLAHGIILKILSRMLMKSDFAMTVPIYFLLFILTLYLFYSGMFSQGPIALLFIIFILARYGIIQ